MYDLKAPYFLQDLIFLMSFACHLHAICIRSYFIYMYSYVIRMSLICARMSSVFTHMCPYVISMSLVYHPYATRVYSFIIRISVVCQSYVIVCHPNVSRMYSYVIRMSLVCTHVIGVSLVCHSNVAHMSLVCTRMLPECHSYVLVCHPFVTRMWFYH